MIYDDYQCSNDNWLSYTDIQAKFIGEPFVIQYIIITFLHHVSIFVDNVTFILYLFSDLSVIDK